MKEKKVDVFNMNIEEKPKKRAEKKSAPKRKKNKQLKEKNEKFNFDNEIVIGVNVIKEKKEDKPRKKVSKQNDKKKDKKMARKTNKKSSNINKKKLFSQSDKIKTNNNKNNKTKNKHALNFKKILELILFMSIIIGLLIFIMTTPLFNVTEIDVYGNSKINEDRIKSLSQVTLNTNTFKFSKRNIVNNIKEEPYVESVTIKRKLPSKIEINVKERVPNYMLKYAGGYVYIDNQGYILEISNEGLKIPIIEGYISKQEDMIPGNRLCQGDLEKLNTVLKIMESSSNNSIDDKITSINIEDKNNYILLMQDERKTVYLGDASNINDRILMLKEILIKESENAGEVFMENLNKIYFRQES